MLVAFAIYELIAFSVMFYILFMASKKKDEEMTEGGIIFVYFVMGQLWPAIVGAAILMRIF